MKRRHLLAGMAAATTVGAGGLATSRLAASTQPRAELRPATGQGLNVLLIVTDQERSWAQLPAGFIERHCPHRSWLRSQGVVVTGANTTTQLCSMARGTIYTGTHAPNNGLWENTPLPYSGGLRRDVPTLGTVFQDAGYRTGYAGKWHLTHMKTVREMPDAERIEKEVRSFGFDEVGLRGESDGANAGLENDAAAAADASGFIRRNTEGQRPWMLAVNLTNPHDIMYYTAGDAMTRSRVTMFPDASARPPASGLYQQDLGYPVFGHWSDASLAQRPNAVKAYNDTWNATMGTLPMDDEAVAREFQNYYLNCMRDCDRHIGTVLEALRQSGQLERTVIVFTSDHGEYLGAHGMRGKGSSIYREASEVPLILIHPEGRKAQQAAALFSPVDLIPTLLGLAGLDSRHAKQQLPQLAGVDQSALAFAPQEPGARAHSGVLGYWTSLTFLTPDNVRRFEAIRHRAMPMRGIEMLQMIRDSVGQYRGAMRGLVTERYKFARYFSPLEHHLPQSWEELSARNDFELYDLASDPAELRNIAQEPQHRQTVERMNAGLNRLITQEIGQDDGSFLPFYMRV